MSRLDKDWKEFIKACQQGDLNTVETLFSQQRVDPAADDNYAIFLAARNGYLDVVKFLAGLKGVDPADKNNVAIYFAACNGHLDVVKFLAGLKDVDPADNNNEAIRWAARHGHLDVVKFLASLECVDPAARDNDAILCAAVRGHFDVVVALMSHIPNIPPRVVTQDVVDIIVRRASLLSHLKLPAELCYLLGERLWGPGAGIYFVKDKQQGATNIIRQLKRYYT